MIKARWVFCCILFLVNPAFADTYYVDEVKSTSVDQQLKHSVFDYIRAEVVRNDQTLVEEKSSADFILETDLIRFGDKYVVQMSKYRNGLGKPQRIEKFEAQKLDELDVTVTRLVRAMLEQRDVQTTAAFGEVTQKEKTLMVDRSEIKRLHYIAMGPFWFSGVNEDEVGGYLALGEVLDVSPRASIKFSLEGSLDSARDAEVSIITANFGGNFYFSPRTNSPFIGADFGYGGVFGDKVKDGTGFSLGGDIGIAFFRTTNAQISVSLRYAQLFLDGEENKGRHPAHYGIVLAVTQ
jgi:hypothetical protein